MNLEKCEISPYQTIITSWRFALNVYQSDALAETCGMQQVVCGSRYAVCYVLHAVLISHNEMNGIANWASFSISVVPLSCIEHWLDIGHWTLDMVSTVWTQ